MNVRHTRWASCLALLSLCAVGAAAGEPSSPVKKVLEKSFVAKGQASLTRLNQDPTQSSYGACSSMPRFGHMGILTEAQLKDVMALLLDPQSPVNQ